ncbi:hypothetical protein [Rhizobium nepotum]|jgi:hypothetical protein|uniref:Uncharacterized protein n=1 Tax=Rhizobium nepotum 39/7 TaxID=1368418 RepID=A0ABR5CV44_9HYPH|nr:hypothetical protein [Rhizobium nepotum]KJF68703.1 hypothetical protein RS75_07225 [Rhizobium nepotum 39/7]
MLFLFNSDEAGALATKSKKKIDPTASPVPDFDLLEARLKRLAEELSEIKLKPEEIKAEKPRRTPGRFKGALVVGPRFFEPLTEEEFDEFATE